MAADCFLKIDGIPGESQDSKHKGEIEILAHNVCLTNPGSNAHGGGGGSGRVACGDYHFTAVPGKHTPLLLQACALGTHYPKAVLTVRKQGGEQQESFTATLSDVLVSSCQIGDRDDFALSYAKIAIDCKAQKADGTLDAAVHGGYDQKLCTKC